MPIDPHEAERRMRANPLNPDAETKATLIATYGEQRYREMRNDATQKQAGNIAVHATSTQGGEVQIRSAPASTNKTIDLHANGGHVRQPAPAPDAANPHDPRNQSPSWEATMANAEAALAQNPIGISSAEKHLLITRWGKAEFNRRRDYAIQAGGFDRMRVTVKP